MTRTSGTSRSSLPQGLMVCTVAESRAATALVKGLRKAVKRPETEWVDANVVRLLLDRYDETKRTTSEDPSA